MTQSSFTLTRLKSPDGKRDHFNAMRQDLLGYLEYAASQGDFLQIPVPFRHLYLLNHPDLAHEVMVKQSRIFHKPFNIKYAAKQVFGENLFTSDGELWQVLRNTLQPGFNVTRLKDYANIVIADTQNLIARLQPGTTLDVTKAFMEITLRSTTQCFFGMDMYSTNAGEKLIRFTELFFEKLTSLPLPLWIPTRINRELRQSRIETRNAFLPIVESRRQSGEDRGDILSMLIKALDTDTTGFITVPQVCNEVSNLFAAGFEVTAYSLAFTLYLIATHPEVEARLREELASVLCAQKISIDVLEHLPYLEQVLKEAMRLYPAAAIISRQAAATTTIAGIEVVKGSTIFVPPWTLHRRPDIFPEPMRFDPNRFSKDNPISKSAYLPFSGGPRTCIGQGFAMMQMRLNLALLLQHFRFHLTEDYEFKPVFQFNIRPQNGLPMRLEAI